MKKLLISTLLITCMLSVISAQEVAVAATDSPKATADISKNFIKLNLTSLPFLNFSLQYERVLSKSISAALSGSFMPETTMPAFIADQLINFAGDMSDEGSVDAQTEDLIRNLLISSYTITPEVRFYLGHNRYSTGFYTAVFYRYSHYEGSNAPIPFTTDLDEEITINTTGSITSHTGGFLLGYQWALGKRMCLDWQMFGPHFGVSSGDFLGLPSSPLSEADQAKIEDKSNDVDIPMFTPTVDATADEVKMIFDGPWGGIRFALSIGVKF
jgi:hypothetical protein